MRGYRRIPSPGPTFAQNILDNFRLEWCIDSPSSSKAAYDIKRLRYVERTKRQTFATKQKNRGSVLRSQSNQVQTPHFLLVQFSWNSRFQPAYPIFHEEAMRRRPTSKASTHVNVCVWKTLGCDGQEEVETREVSLSGRRVPHCATPPTTTSCSQPEPTTRLWDTCPFIGAPQLWPHPILEILRTDKKFVTGQVTASPRTSRIIPVFPFPVLF